MIPVIAPVFLYLRHKFGERILPISQNSVAIIGDNKNEKLALQKKDLLFIHAVENYIDIYFNDVHNKVSSKTFRQTLSKVHLQLPFLEKCHRSYLVNIENIIEIKGNSQSAKIYFENYNGKIPLSKTQYKLIKTAIGNQKKGDPQH
ncbi:MAG: LytTR family transcriptional regulator DNA-binding domain-containing protein [Crocinitomicaceae bacterium]